MNDNERIATWRGWINVGGPTPWLNKDSERFHGVPPYEQGCGWWHGKHGLLAEIEKRGCVISFMSKLTDAIREETTNGTLAWWDVITATPAQLAAAMVKMIEAHDVPEI